jgi:16S rRNA (adenine1518-N6/adenine1519-N6)-dimethyltransferase
VTTSTPDAHHPPRTERAIKSFLARHAIRPRRRLGQNFMVDANLIQLMIRSAQIQPGDRVLEVGTGTGLLTWPLGQAGASVVTVEADPRLYNAAALYLDGVPWLHRVGRDVLEGKHRLAPEIEETMANWGEGRYKVVSNLPYQVAVPVILLLLESEFRPERMVVTVQKEVADRLLADPGSPHYGRVSVERWVRADAHRLRNLGPEIFWPRPRVESSLLEIIPTHPDQHLARASHAAFKRFLAAVFGQRRKQLASAFRGQRDTMRHCLADLKIDPLARGEQLTPDQLVAVFRACT